MVKAVEQEQDGLQSRKETIGTSVGFSKRVTGKLKWPLFSQVNFFFSSFYRHYFSIRRKGAIQFQNFECMHELPKEGDLW